MTASAVHNDDPLRKNRLKSELSSMRLTRGLPFEEGARVLWEMVDDLHGGHGRPRPVLGDLEGFSLDKLKEEMLFTFISSNPDYDEVVKDYYRYVGDYPGMTLYSHCVQVYSRLKLVAAANGNRGGNRGDGGDSQSGGRFHSARREFGRFADERPRQASPVQREKFRFDEEPRQAPNESARRATKPEMSHAQREGWDPTSRQKGYLSTRADTVATVQGDCFCYQLYGRCPYGDTVRGAGEQGCKYAHVDKHGKTVTSGVLTTVPVCTRCRAQGKHWSFHCNGGDGGGPHSRGEHGGRGAGGGGGAGGPGWGRGASGPGRGAKGGSPGAGRSGRGAAGGGQRGDRGRGRGGGVQQRRLARSITWQEPIEEPSERFTARKAIATVDVHACSTWTDVWSRSGSGGRNAWLRFDCIGDGMYHSIVPKCIFGPYLADVDVW
jgi:hypothetical protein